MWFVGIFSQFEDFQLFVLFYDCRVQQQNYHTAEQSDSGFNVRRENWSFWTLSRWKIKTQIVLNEQQQIAFVTSKKEE